MRGLVKQLLMVLVVVTAGHSARGQTFWSIEGGFASTGEYNSPPPACGLPPGPVFGPPGSACGSVAPFPPLACIGGTSVDQDGNPASGGPGFPCIVNSDGIMLELMTPAGAPIVSGPVGGGAVLPGLISGVGCDSAADIYYVTDGIMAVGVGVPPGPFGLCGPPPILVPPFPVAAAGVVACGLAYAPCTGTVWTCDPTGFVANYTTTGIFLGGFFVGPPMGPFLTGCTVNLTNGNIQVTDGFMLAEYTPAGALAPAGAFYLTANPMPVPLWGGFAVDGLGFALAPVKYGRPCSRTAFLPTIGSAGGYTWAGNPAFTVFETGASPGVPSFLLVGFAPACPPLPFAGCTLWIAPPWLGIIATGPTTAAGTKTIPAPLPAAVPPPCGSPVGVPIFLQFINFPGGGLIETTDALTFTIGGI